MKNKIVLFIFYCIITAFVYCQSQAYLYFNNYYDCNNNKWSIAYSVYETSYGYIAVGISKNTSNSRVICILKTDKNGNKIEVKNIGKSGCDLWPGAQGSLIKTNDGGYALGGGITNGTNNKFLLVKFDANGDTVWTRSYGDNTQNAFCTARQCKQCWDKGYILVGEKNMGANYQDVLLVRTDSLGNQKWVKTYGGTSNDGGWSIVVTPDSGFFIGGGTYSNKLNALVIKTDSMGNMQWQKEFGGNFDDGVGYVNNLRDGNLFVNFSYGISQTQQSEPPNSRLNVIKLDLSGNYIFNKLVGPIKWIYGMPGFIELPDGKFIISGYYGNPTGTDPATIMKLTANGDSIWMKEYKRLFEYGSMHFFYNIKPTSDNGLILCGEVFAPFEPPNGHSFWLVKLDSLGCLEPNCDGNIIVPNVQTESNSFCIYPNPAQEKINLLIKKKEISGSILSLYNFQGQQVLQEDIKEITTVIDITQLPTGIYVAKLCFAKGDCEQQRFVVVKE